MLKVIAIFVFLFVCCVVLCCVGDCGFFIIIIIEKKGRNKKSSLVFCLGLEGLVKKSHEGILWSCEPKFFFYQIVTRKFFEKFL